jgi:hypothetical protein
MLLHIPERSYEPPAVKSEIRISKFETNRKLEIQNDEPLCSGFLFRVLSFGFVSDFEIRISNL